VIGRDRLALLASGAAAFLAGVGVAMHAIQPDLDPARHYVSEYAHGELGWLVTVGYVAAGVATLVLAWQLVAGLGRARWPLAAAACLALVSIGLVATGVTRIDLAQPDGSVISTASGTAHELAGYIAILGLLPGAFVVSGAFRRDPRLVGVAGGARLLAWAILATFAGVIAAQSLDLVGIGQRLFIGTWLAWLIYVSLVLSGLATPRDRSWRAAA
jgi:Protein of unknown function (DUF998)